MAVGHVLHRFARFRPRDLQHVEAKALSGQLIERRRSSFGPIAKRLTVGQENDLRRVGIGPAVEQLVDGQQGVFEMRAHFQLERTE
jgi:hypothetical protein